MNGTTFLSRITAWRGFLLLLIIVGAVMTINGLANPRLDRLNRIGFLIFGLWAALVGAMSWLAIASTKFKGPLGKAGLSVELRAMPTWAWIFNLAMTVLAIAIFVVVR
jgi:hypothetical protein